MTENLTDKKQLQKLQKRVPSKKAEFELYARYLAFPIEERIKAFGYYTDQDFAKHNNIKNSHTLTDWKKIPKLWEFRDQFLSSEFKKYTPDVLAGLRRTATKDGKATEVMAWMKIVEGYVEKQKIEKEERILIINLNKDV